MVFLTLSYEKYDIVTDLNLNSRTTLKDKKLQEPMKILMIAPQPFFQPRGTPFSVLGRLYALSELGHHVDLVTYHLGQNVSIRNVNIYRVPFVPFINSVKVGPSLAKIPLDILLFVKAIQLLSRNKYQLLHTHEEAGFFGVFLKYIFRLPHVYDMHSSLPQQLHNFKFSNSQLLHRIFLALENLTLKTSDAVITICPDLYRYVQKLGIARSLILIENVVEYARLFDDPDGLLSDVMDVNRVANRIKVLYSGTLEPYQGLDLLIDSAVQVVRQVPTVLFLIVGGKPDQIAKYREKIRQRGLEDYFVLTGSVSPTLAEQFVEYTDILVSPRISGNNTPLKIYSYLRSGKPIVATRLSTHTQVLNDSVAVLTAPTPVEFGRGLLKVLQDRQFGERIGRNAQKLASEKYSYSLYLQRMQKVLKSIQSTKLN